MCPVLAPVICPVFGRGGLFRGRSVPIISTAWSRGDAPVGEVLPQQ